MRLALVVMVLAAPARAGDYALIVAGGYDADSNSLVFARGAARMAGILDGWQTTVLSGDGADNADGWDTPPWCPPGDEDSWYYTAWYSGVYAWPFVDGYALTSTRSNAPALGVDGPATFGAFEAACEGLSNLTADDRLVVYMSNHGGLDDTGGYRYGFWGGIVEGDRIATALSGIAADTTIILSACHAGAFADHIPGVRLLAQAPADGLGYVLPPIHYADGPRAGEWALGDLGYAEAVMDALEGLPDLDDDGMVLWSEIHQWAYDNDTFGPVVQADPWCIEYPAMYGPDGVWFAAGPGDTDMDGDVDGSDLAALGMGWSPAGVGLGWSRGDFDGDGDVDGTDLAHVGMHWSPVSAVPEPAAAWLLLAGLFVKGKGYGGSAKRRSPA